MIWHLFNNPLIYPHFQRPCVKEVLEQFDNTYSYLDTLNLQMDTFSQFVKDVESDKDLMEQLNTICSMHCTTWTNVIKIIRFDIDAREKKQKGDTSSKVEPYLKRIRDAFNEGSGKD